MQKKKMGEGGEEGGGGFCDFFPIIKNWNI